jgi:hypothetical protein
VSFTGKHPTSSKPTDTSFEVKNLSVPIFQEYSKPELSPSTSILFSPES